MTSRAPDTSAKRLLLPLAIVLALASLELGCGGNVVVDHGGNGQGGSGSGSGGGSSGTSMFGTPQVACQLSAGGLQICEQLFNAPPNEVAEIKSGCGSSNGTLIPACSSDGVVGCCVLAAAGAEVEECFYGGVTLAEAQMACKGQDGKFSTSP